MSCLSKSNYLPLSFVRKKFYNKFLKNMRGHLLNSGYEIVADNKYALIFNLDMEDILFPKNQINKEYLQLFFCHKKEIVYEFNIYTQYLLNAQTEVLKHLEKRRFEQLARYDNI